MYEVIVVTSVVKPLDQGTKNNHSRVLRIYGRLSFCFVLCNEHAADTKKKSQPHDSAAAAVLLCSVEHTAS